MTPPTAQRTSCNVCGQSMASGGVEPQPCPCHVQAFAGETFHLWRCPTCRTIHCLEVVDLERYYARYPFRGRELTWPWRVFYRNLARRLTAFGFDRGRSLLDYGCGDGLFVEYLRTRGFTRCYGYDPHASGEGLGNRTVLAAGPFDFILLQDVLEHVEQPEALLAELDPHLAPGGRMLVGTPNADRVDPARPERFLNELHAPYHLHIYTRQTVEQFGRRRGWQPIGFFDRPYHDRPWLGLNSRAAKEYQRRIGGTMDAALGPLRWNAVLTSPKLWFYMWFGYWLSDRSDQTVVFEKPCREPVNLR